ncbi:unnamed protein product [Phytomonas sp. Hart1]|nr:unnamed protein product [Phytomonas sp. Hart1]|eukprot:CCW66748.1 unnamed protein product [Phytomonas sp. isolate Hart1]
MTQNSSSSSLQNMRSWTRMFEEAKNPTQSSSGRSSLKHPFQTAKESQFPSEPSKPHFFDRLEQLHGSTQGQAVLSLRASAEMSSKFKNEEKEVDESDRQQREWCHSRPVSLLTRMRSFLFSMSQRLQKNDDEVSHGIEQNPKLSPSGQHLCYRDRGPRLSKRQRRTPIGNLPESKCLSCTDNTKIYPEVLESNGYHEDSIGKIDKYNSHSVSAQTASSMNTHSFPSSSEAVPIITTKGNPPNYEPPLRRGRRYALASAGAALISTSTSPSQMRQSWSWVTSTDSGVKPSEDCTVMGSSVDAKVDLLKEVETPSFLGNSVASGDQNLKVTSIFKMDQDNPRQHADPNIVSHENEERSLAHTGKLTDVAVMRMAVHDRGNIPELSQESVHTAVSVKNQHFGRGNKVMGKRKQVNRNLPNDDDLQKKVRCSSNELIDTHTRYIVFDTSSLLASDPGVLNLLVEQCVICIPFTVIDELDKLNKGVSKTMPSAETEPKREWVRHRSREIRNFISAQQKSERQGAAGVGFVRIQRRTEVIPEYHEQAKNNDDYILEFAVYLKEREKLHLITFVSEDKFLCIKAKTELGNSCSYADLKRSLGLRS